MKIKFIVELKMVFYCFVTDYMFYFKLCSSTLGQGPVG